jgi:hypothetical protein
MWGDFFRLFCCFVPFIAGWINLPGALEHYEYGVLRKNYFLTDKNVSDSAPIEKNLYFYSDEKPDKTLINQIMNNFSLLKSLRISPTFKIQIDHRYKGNITIGDIRMLAATIKNSTID